MWTSPSILNQQRGRGLLLVDNVIKLWDFMYFCIFLLVYIYIYIDTRCLVFYCVSTWILYFHKWVMINLSRTCITINCKQVYACFLFKPFLGLKLNRSTKGHASEHLKIAVEQAKSLFWIWSNLAIHLVTPRSPKKSQEASNISGMTHEVIEN